MATATEPASPAAHFLERRKRMLIGGKWIEARRTRALEVYDPPQAACHIARHPHTGEPDMNASTTATKTGRQPLPAGVDLERRLEELLSQERFPPPAGFLTEAFGRDASLHAAAERDVNAFWAGQARRLHWDVPFTTVLDDSNPPFYKWFTDGKLNVSYNCLDRHVETGRGNRVAFHWVGEEGEERRVTYAQLLDDVQRLANALKQLGVPRATSSGSIYR